MTPLATLWTTGLQGKQKEDAEAAIRASTTLCRQLLLILDQRLQSNQRTTKADYDSPSWAYSQADQNGYLRCLSDIKQLFNFTQG